MDATPQLTRLIQALKGTGRLSSPKARICQLTVTTRDNLTQTAFGTIQAVNGRGTSRSGDTTTTLTDPNGNSYAMTDMPGFAENATLY